MVWSVRYHPDVQDDYRKLGRSDAEKVRKVIKERLANGEPDKIGKALSGEMSGYRRLRTGHLRIVYSLDGDRIEVLVIAVGLRRDDEVYDAANHRVR